MRDPYCSSSTSSSLVRRRALPGSPLLPGQKLYYSACSAPRLCLRDKVCPAPTKMNMLAECQHREMTERTATILRPVRVVHFEVRQLLRHLRPRYHRLFWIGSAAASNSLFTESRPAEEKFPDQPTARNTVDRRSPSRT